jgi:outer membrane protein OmpA-like peptidoglycan-associated protein
VRWRNRQVTMTGTATAAMARRTRRAAAVLAGAANVRDELTVVPVPAPAAPVSTTSPTTTAPTVHPPTVVPSVAPTTQPPVVPAASPVSIDAMVDSTVVLFARDSMSLSVASSSDLDRLAEALRAGPATAVVEIDGYTDSTGNDAQNLLLSQQRAEAVRLALVARGVNPAMLRGRARGSSEPVASNATAAGRARNRRVQLRIVS